MQKPNALKTGDSVMIIAPSSPPNIENVMKMKLKIEQAGLNVLIGKGVTEKRGYLAGSDANRVSDLHDAFSDSEVKAVLCATGGYGSGRLLQDIDFELIKNNPKIFWGYSDITALHIALQQKANLVTFHGPMMQECGVDTVPPKTLASFKQLLEPLSLTFTASEVDTYPAFSHSVTAPMTGGNLTVLTSTIGTPYEVDTKGKILFIEDIQEEPYRIDRMINQLRLANKLQECKGIILGNFNDCGPKKRQNSLTIADIVNDLIVPLGLPVLSGFLIGHCSPNYGVPFGVPVTMNGADQSISFEPGIQMKECRPQK
ncbi:MULTISPECIES: LD-carboxypeptidase [Bacillaceae]|uniref:LD-carboxypeptidase n=1 Tax=Gottfriedia luciferensis TaxID=178774 RepID=A0ABX2ZUP3_9BACI|nr:MULTISPECIES: LD-carboxypeptidase [Bacillaceae]ODG93465.1 LD-carboxypeptidase [Gottfriedia luciferensis]SFC45974.1 muramoyltetrapeptide carboxypeptidase [Bacillus sp. UNCCL81]